MAAGGRPLLTGAQPAAWGAARAFLIAGCVIGFEFARVTAGRDPRLTLASLLVGGAALCLPGLAFRPAELGLGLARLTLRLLGGLALAVVLLLPGAVRWSGGPEIAPQYALAAILVSIGEEVAFRGALYAALEQAWGAPAAVAGSALAFTTAHVLSHPPAFLVAVAAVGLLLGLWRWACRDLVAPIVGHALADLWI